MGNYHAPMVWWLHEAGFYVSVVNPVLTRNYGNNSVRYPTNGMSESWESPALRIGMNCPVHSRRRHPIDAESFLPAIPAVFQRADLLKNNLISLFDTAFPDANRLFSSSVRTDGSEMRVDFVAAFRHCECVCELTEKTFTAKYQKWCKKHGYHFNQDKALDWTSMLLPVDTSASCRKRPHPNSWLDRPSPSFKPLRQHWPHLERDAVLGGIAPRVPCGDEDIRRWVCPRSATVGRTLSGLDLGQPLTA